MQGRFCREGIRDHENGEARAGRRMNNRIWEERSKRSSRVESLAGPWEKALHELSTRQNFSEEPQYAAGQCSVCPFFLSAGMSSGPFNLISDSHGRDGDPVGGNLHDARGWVYTANGLWVNVSTLMRPSPLARLADYPKPAAILYFVGNYCVTTTFVKRRELRTFFRNRNGNKNCIVDDSR